MMRKITIIATLLIYSSVLFAQKVRVSESNERIGGGNNNALSVTIYQASADDIEKDVKSLMKKYDARVSSKDGELFGDNAMIKKISLNTIDMYARVEKVNDEETRVIMAFDLGGVFLSSSKGEQFKVAKDMLQDFATKTTADAIAGIVKMEEKKFDKLSDEEKRLIREDERLKGEIADNKSKIEECNRRIKEAENNLETNRKNRELKKQEVAIEQKVLGEVKEKQKRFQ